MANKTSHNTDPHILEKNNSFNNSIIKRTWYSTEIKLIFLQTKLIEPPVYESFR